MSGYKLTFEDKKLAVLLGANEMLPDIINDEKLINFYNWFSQADKKGNTDNCEKWLNAFNEQLLKNCTKPLRNDTDRDLENRIEQTKNESELIEVLKNNVQDSVKDKNILFKERLAKYRVDPNEKLLEPEIVWSVKVQDKVFPAGTKGNFSTIIGKPKSKKTFSLTLFLADYLKIHNGKRVLYFDTEQSKYHVQKAVKRIINKNGIAHENFEVYHFRSLSTEERLELIEQAIYFYNDVDLVVIDGVRDLITSINDEVQATMITSKFLKWTEERNIHIITVLHQNKGDDKARGHVGTEIMNKAELVLSVTPSEQDKDTSFIETVVSRNIAIEPFAFKVDEQGIPHQLEEWSKPQKSANNKPKIPKAFELSEPKQIEVVKEVFAIPLNYMNSIDSLILHFQTQKIEVATGVSEIKRYLKYLVDHNYLTQAKGLAKNPKSTFYSLHSRLK